MWRLFPVPSWPQFSACQAEAAAVLPLGGIHVSCFLERKKLLQAPGADPRRIGLGVGAVCMGVPALSVPFWEVDCLPVAVTELSFWGNRICCFVGKEFLLVPGRGSGRGGLGAGVVCMVVTRLPVTVWGIQCLVLAAAFLTLGSIKLSCTLHFLWALGTDPSKRGLGAGVVCMAVILLSVPIWELEGLPMTVAELPF